MGERGLLMARLRNEDGFTLMELLVSMTAGLVVVAAAFLTLQISVTTQTSASDRVESTQRGRETMNLVARVLRSHTCLGDTKPGLVEATATSLRVHSAMGPERLSPGYQKIDDRRLVYDATTRKLTMDTYNGTDATPASTATPLTVTFSSTVSSSKVIGENIRLDGTTPIFRYYTFNTATPPTATQQVDPGTGSLNQTQRQSIVRIEVTYLVRDRDSNSASAKATRFTDSFYIRTADPDATTAGGGCQ